MERRNQPKMARQYGWDRVRVHKGERYIFCNNSLQKWRKKMKCVMCNGALKEKVVEHKEFGISLGKFKALVCNSCNERFYDSDVVSKIQLKSKELGLFGLARKTKVAQVGNSLAIRIPKEIAKFIKLKKEEEVRIIPKNPKEIIIEVK